MNIRWHIHKYKNSAKDVRRYSETHDCSMNEAKHALSKQRKVLEVQDKETKEWKEIPTVVTETLLED